VNRTGQSEEDEDDCVVQKSTGKKMAVKPIANTGKEKFSENTENHISFGQSRKVACYNAINTVSKPTANASNQRLVHNTEAPWRGAYYGFVFVVFVVVCVYRFINAYYRSCKYWSQPQR